MEHGAIFRYPIDQWYCRVLPAVIEITTRVSVDHVADEYLSICRKIYKTVRFVIVISETCRLASLQAYQPMGFKLRDPSKGPQVYDVRIDR